MAINSSAERRVFERRFFLAIAILFPITILIGFAPTYYLKGFFNSPPIPSTLVHLHGLAMSLWVILFAAQVYLIRSTRIKLHQQLGIAAVGLAIAIFILGMTTGIASAARGGGVPGIPPLQFLIVPFGDIVVFAVLFGAAVDYRRNAPNHKRLILLTILNFLPPALGRFPFEFTGSLGPVWFFGIPDLLAILFVVMDTWRNKKLNKVFLAGAIFLIVSHWLRLALMPTAAWVNFATWLTSFAA
ncbi:MAG: hypothetical protein ABI481_09485 [Pyrinomonadaceae bacterium]